MKKTIRDNIQTAYSLHDMNVIAFEVSGNDVTMRTQSGMVKTTPPYKQVDGFVEFHDLDWNFSFVYLMDGYGNVGKFTGEKLYFKDFNLRRQQEYKMSARIYLEMFIMVAKRQQQSGC